MKLCICAGPPCYEYCSMPVITGMRSPAKFMSALKYATEEYNTRHGLSAVEVAEFPASVENRVFDASRIEVAAAYMQRVV